MKRPVVFIKPHVKSSFELFHYFSENAEAEGIEIYEIEDAKEAVQVTANIGTCLIIASDQKVCATFLLNAQKYIKKNQSKCILVSREALPAKAYNKLKGINLVDNIVEPIPPKTLVYKTRIHLKSLIIKSEENEDFEKRLKSNEKEDEPSLDLKFNKKKKEEVEATSSDEDLRNKMRLNSSLDEEGSLDDDLRSKLKNKITDEPVLSEQKEKYKLEIDIEKKEKKPFILEPTIDENDDEIRKKLSLDIEIETEVENQDNPNGQIDLEIKKKKKEDLQMEISPDINLKEKEFNQNDLNLYEKKKKTNIEIQEENNEKLKVELAPTNPAIENKSKQEFILEETESEKKKFFLEPIIDEDDEKRRHALLLELEEEEKETKETPTQIEEIKKEKTPIFELNLESQKEVEKSNLDILNDLKEIEKKQKESPQLGEVFDPRKLVELDLVDLEDGCGIDDKGIGEVDNLAEFSKKIDLGLFNEEERPIEKNENQNLDLDDKKNKNEILFLDDESPNLEDENEEMLDENIEKKKKIDLDISIENPNKNDFKNIFEDEDIENKNSNFQEKNQPGFLTGKKEKENPIESYLSKKLKEIEKEDKNGIIFEKNNVDFIWGDIPPLDLNDKDQHLKKQFAEEILNYQKIKNQFLDKNYKINNEDTLNIIDKPISNQEKIDLEQEKIFHPDSKGIEELIIFLPLFLNKNLKNNELILHFKKRISDRFNGQCLFYWQKPGQSNLETTDQINSNNPTWELEQINKIESLTLPFWYDENFIESKNFFFHPYYEGLNRLGGLAIFFSTNILVQQKETIENFSDSLRGVILNEYYKDLMQKREYGTIEIPKSEKGFFSKFFKKSRSA